jgi:hypothetical protein
MVRKIQKNIYSLIEIKATSSYKESIAVGYLPDSKTMTKTEIVTEDQTRQRMGA